MSKQTRNTLLLVLCAFIWGTAFVAQSMGAGLGAYTFLACRSWLGVAVLYPTVRCFDAIHKRQGLPYGGAKTKEERKFVRKGAISCGTVLFAASAAQQIAITLDQSTAKASFITAMYVVLVPVLGILLGRKNSAQIWFCVLLSVVGLYLLCMTGGFGAVHRSDMILLLGAFLYSMQILTVDYYSPKMDGVRLSMFQFIVVGVWSTAFAFIFEQPALGEIGLNLIPILYCGVMSSGVAYTLQILGQRDLNPAIASLAMCLESVFGALGGFVILHQLLTAREVLGCALIFAAVVLAELPLGRLLHRQNTV